MTERTVYVREEVVRDDSGRPIVEKHGPDGPVYLTRGVPRTYGTPRKYWRELDRKDAKLARKARLRAIRQAAGGAS